MGPSSPLFYTKMDTVKVALRIRPLVRSELDNGCRSCIERVPGEPQISIGKNNQTYTFNYVFDENEGQNKVYNLAVQGLIENLFKGYNLTILAYGQTGSGKTYTMGTNYQGDGELGVIPRAVYDIFETIGNRKDLQFHVTVSFLELYNEALYDLLTDKPREQSVVDMREANNGICIPGLTEIPVSTADYALEILKTGSNGRVVGSTLMNASSSRSHAVFTISIKIMNRENPKEVIASKFHLVDLAGSERSKKTGATGDRFKEGININKGLMVLGNVISQLGEGNHHFINYRDSKLTRLLQDSLGGNSVTLMIACVSPADYNHDESLSTLRYADRAKKIKNKPVVNQDPASAELSRLRKENEELRLKILGSGLPGPFNCPPEHAELSSELMAAQRKITELSKNLYKLMDENIVMHEKTQLAEKHEESMREKLNTIDSIFESSQQGIDSHAIRELRDKISDIQTERSKVTQEMHQLERTNSEKSNYTDGLDNEPPSPSKLKHIQEHFAMFKEIDSITKSLLWKEELLTKLKESEPTYKEIGGQESVDELKKQIAELQKEKEDLQNQMKETTLTSIAATSKVSERRRLRLQELEQKVAALMKKVTEQERLIKMKEQNEAKIKQLKVEIMASKQQKVRLIHTMKSESDKFRQYKQSKDKEVCHLRTQTMKKQNEMKKMEQIHALQQNVLKRKLEAAAAANKRIMAALERQKAAKMKRLKSTLTERIKDKLAEELELIESEHQAQKSLDTLIQDRAALNKELSIIKESLDDPAVSQEEKVKLHSDMKEIEDGLAMRCAEISDLQQKLMDIRQDDRGNWDILNSMSDAKFAVSHVISLVSDRIKEALNMSQQFAELKEQLVEQEMISEERKKKLEDLTAYHESAMRKLENESEHKVYILLRRFKSNGNTDDVASEVEKLHLEALEKKEEMRNRILELEEELRQYKANPRKTVNTYEEAFIDFVGGDKSNMGPPKTRSSMANSRRTKNITFVEDEENLDASLEIDNDDPRDPDWRGTPLYKRIQSLKARNTSRSQNTSGEEECEGGILKPKRINSMRPRRSQLRGLRMTEEDPDLSISMPRRTFVLED